MEKKRNSLDISKIGRIEIYRVIEKHWPINISGIARELGLNPDGEHQKRVVARISYHVNKLKQEEKVHTKKIDRAVVIWPHEIEKIRFIHEMLK
ncbi:hypothetical protein DRN74_04485 [Candidatus Micrarchaeota archaeon]|nr:MAG: hypothetical protein DRN74_04485 [Candidatus Micrarchaeota archaeon]